ncbi:MAG: hypothetical protein ACYTGV_00510 [Planctomycetota bacterium]|jgi:hypothetical protein
METYDPLTQKTAEFTRNILNDLADQLGLEGPTDFAEPLRLEKVVGEKVGSPEHGVFLALQALDIRIRILERRLREEPPDSPRAEPR